MDKQLKEKIQQLAKEAKVKFGKPLTLEEIQETETKLRLKIPQEYRDFLEIFGCMQGVGLEVLGRAPDRFTVRRPTGEIRGSALGRTLDLREAYPTFPKNCIAIEFDGGEGWYCIVCGGEDHGKVIYWDMWCDPEQAYPNIPKPEWFKKHPNWAKGHITGKKEDFWVEAFDFWSWLIKRLEETKREVEEKRKGK